MRFLANLHPERLGPPRPAHRCGGELLGPRDGEAGDVEDGTLAADAGEFLVDAAAALDRRAPGGSGRVRWLPDATGRRWVRDHHDRGDPAQGRPDAPRVRRGRRLGTRLGAPDGRARPGVSGRGRDLARPAAVRALSLGAAFISAEGMMTGTWHSFLVRAGLLVAGVSGPLAANANTLRVPAANASEVTGADRERAD